jgi:ribosome-associated translation inhibitor RaiA
MRREVQVTFRNMDPSPALEQAIRERAAWLESYYSGIVGCKVTVEMPHRRRQRGRPVHVRIELSVPGEDVVVTHVPTLKTAVKDVHGDTIRKADDVEGAHKDAFVSVHDAFDTARRRLEDFARRQRGDVKTRQRA